METRFLIHTYPKNLQIYIEKIKEREHKKGRSRIRKKNECFALYTQR